jgi:hypothetical protein
MLRMPKNVAAGGMGVKLAAACLSKVKTSS